VKALRNLSLALSFVGVISSAPALAAPEPYLGEIMIGGWNFCPRGWAEMNGQIVVISTSPALFSLLGTTYGGDGQTTFALPTAKPLFTGDGILLRQCIAVEGAFPPRD
jgi:microcystin-dependent protein